MKLNKIKSGITNFSNKITSATKIAAVVAGLATTACQKPVEPDFPTTFGQTELSVKEGHTGAVGSFGIKDDNGIKSVTVDGNFNNFFDINNKGNISVKPDIKIDYQKTPTIEGNLTVTDNLGNETTKKVTVDVKIIVTPPNQTEFSAPKNNEIGSKIGLNNIWQYIGEKNGDNFTAEILANGFSSNPFEIDQNGDVITTKSFDFEGLTPNQQQNGLPITIAYYDKNDQKIGEFTVKYKVKNIGPDTKDNEMIPTGEVYSPSISDKAAEFWFSKENNNYFANFVASYDDGEITMEDLRTEFGGTRLSEFLEEAAERTANKEQSGATSSISGSMINGGFGNDADGFIKPGKDNLRDLCTIAKTGVKIDGDSFAFSLKIIEETLTKAGIPPYQLSNWSDWRVTDLEMKKRMRRYDLAVTLFGELILTNAKDASYNDPNGKNNIFADALAVAEFLANIGEGEEAEAKLREMAVKFYGIGFVEEYWD